MSKDKFWAMVHRRHEQIQSMLDELDKEESFGFTLQFNHVDDGAEFYDVYWVQEKETGFDATIILEHDTSNFVAYVSQEHSNGKQAHAHVVEYHEDDDDEVVGAL